MVTAKPASGVPRQVCPGTGWYVHRCLDAARDGVRTISPMSTTDRRIVTATTTALATMALEFAVVAIRHRRPDAGAAEDRSHSPLVRPSW